MKSKKTTRRALLTSMLSLLICVSMLVGSTFAWFTDSVTSANNIIKSGNLDVELYYMNDETSDWTKVTESTNIFKENTLWEPGHTEVVKLKVVNEGTLALKYQLGVNVASETGSVNVKGDAFKLSDHIKFGIVEGERDYTREQAVDAVEGTAEKLNVVYNSTMTELLPRAEDTTAMDVYTDIITLVVYMPTSVGNEANYGKGEAIPTINLGINLFATQREYEKDSFDENYDKDNAVSTIAEAEAQMAEGKDVTLVGCNEPDNVLGIPAAYTGTLTLVNSSIKSVQAEEDANIVILGNVVVNAKGNVAAVAETGEDGSAISAKGKLTISGTGSLTAIAADKNGAFGIGGMEATKVTIKGITIDYVSGGYAYCVGSDTKYYKNAPEGGAAIGSGYNGAVITLDGVTITKAIGGSKAAGIGARYHVGVTVNITESEILYVEGGVSAAGIGGSRVSSGAAENGTTINITGSTVTAQGGAYGAGVGSGYDTHCLAEQPLCTINITDSAINATGGKYAAGVGSGYHNAALTGEIRNSTVKAASGEKFYKAEYTLAMDVGFGVVDPTREGQQTSSKLIYNGTEITIPEVIVIGNWEKLDVVRADTTVSNKVAEEYVEICHKGGNLTLKNVTFKNGLTIYNETATAGTVTLENCTIYLSNGTTANTGYNMCKADYGLYLGAISKNVIWKFKNCTFTAADGHTYAGDSGYNVYIASNYNAESITFEGCTFEKSAKHGIGCSSDADATYYALTVTGCNFKDWNNNATNGAAIRGNLPASDFAANITISGNTFGNSNGSTQKTVAIDSWNGSWN